MNERATGSGRGAMMRDERWIESGPEVGGGRAAAGGGCACSRSEPCALRFVPLDEQTVPRRKDVTKPGPASCLCRAAWCVCMAECVWCAWCVCLSVSVSACAQVQWLMRKVALPPAEVRSLHVTLHIAFRGCPVWVDPCRGSHMLRQTEKGVQGELGRSQAKAMTATSLYCLWGGGGLEGCMDSGLHGRSQKGRDRERKHSWGRLDTIYCMRPGRRVRLSSGCQTSDTCQRRGLEVSLSPQHQAPGQARQGRPGRGWAGMERWLPPDLGKQGVLAGHFGAEARGQEGWGDGGMVRMNWEGGTRSRPFPTAP